MRKIDRPRFTARDVFGVCINNVRDARLKQELVNSIDVIESAEVDFDSKKQTNILYSIRRGQAVNAVVNAEQLKKVYKERLLNKNNPGRVYYNTLLLSAPNGKCPLCSQHNATTLDHYLPKNEYPLLSVAPLNLVPCCKDCNTGKLCDYPINSAEETLHPYYDDVEGFEWLKCRIIHVAPMIIEYFVDAPPEVDPLLRARIEYHFESFNLNQLYTIHANEEFANINIQITNLFNAGGKDLLIAFLQECHISRKAINQNSWQTAFYYALLSSDDFCNGEFVE